MDGAKEGDICLRDRACESKKCRFFRCEKRIAVKDGPCKKSADCLNNQVKEAEFVYIIVI